MDVYGKRIRKNETKMRVIIDVMGGDYAPEEAVKGVIQATQELSADFVLVGNRAEIERIAAENDFDLQNTEIVHTDEVITMDDDPLCVVRGNQNSSMAIGLKMLADGHGDAFVSMGNTGALFTGATLIVRKIKGIRRAGIGTVLPFQNPVLLLDTGANVTVTEEVLEQFGVIGSAYMAGMYGIQNPRIGLLNNGVEDCKGTELQRGAYRRLKENSLIRFVGNVEGNFLPFDCCDVIVADGFTGNILLKTTEGLGKLLLGKLQEVFQTSPVTQLAALSMKKQLRALKRQFDASEYGGSPILGISKPVIKAHGSSDAKAFKNAIRQAVHYADSEAIYDIAASIRLESDLRQAAVGSDEGHLSEAKEKEV